MVVKSGENIGSYHVIDGHKVSLRYAGRCHENVKQKEVSGLSSQTIYMECGR